ncbi:hypothetical protein SAMD00023353_5500250 [Rosellinia necatrix]|uniref:Uncharacterized protein n=1 Tax=Rosellinia necatrix TaxID=77044 RepID=A0A1S8AAB2_ROSNE|nr:hypothetical protein SAMD00023353_5500250 [Rosellinia necatrix]
MKGVTWHIGTRVAELALGKTETGTETGTGTEASSASAPCVCRPYVYLRRRRRVASRMGPDSWRGLDIFVVHVDDAGASCHTLAPAARPCERPRAYDVPGGGTEATFPRARWAVWYALGVFASGA